MDFFFFEWKDLFSTAVKSFHHLCSDEHTPPPHPPVKCKMQQFFQVFLQMSMFVCCAILGKRQSDMYCLYLLLISGRNGTKN